MRSAVTERTLSISPSATSGFPTTWVITDEYGFSGKVIQVYGQTTRENVTTTLNILAENTIDRIIVRADGVGGAFVDLLYVTEGLHIPILSRYIAAVPKHGLVKRG